MTLSLMPLSQDQTAWLHDAASAYFRELVPDRAGPPLQEVTDWFEDPDIYPLLVSQSDQRVGFALIERTGTHHELSEFCILPDWRDAGIGTHAATLCFARHPGRWALGVAKALPGTIRFWDRLLPSLPAITRLARGPALTPYQCHSYTFDYKGAP
ncbi:GNAT family N-acetyltransferase [Tateyamaria armeniaca]|uniref:GNAT family N-acetyltransferase n=1 Tax=Tateyamaria armeniaca TaxID=2518930 RepID=A0ABW8UZ38_9RHOB